MAPVDQIVLAGASADGNGILTRWTGAGKATRVILAEILVEANLPAEWAPAARSAESYAGRAIKRVANEHGLIKSKKTADAAIKAARRKGEGWDARWTLDRPDKAAEVGDSAGLAVASIELYEDGDEAELVIVALDPAVEAEIQAAYREQIEAEEFEAADVTGWCKGILLERLGATTHPLGFYIPAEHRAQAEALVAAIAPRWGTMWCNPPVPVATGPELLAGIAGCFVSDVQKLRSDLDKARAATKKDEITPARAAKLLAELLSVHDRAASYRELCGAELIAAPVAEIAELRAELVTIADDASQRFALLDLDGPSAQPEVAEGPSPAERAAEDALAARRPKSQATEPAPEPTSVVLSPEPMPPVEPSDAGVRFSLLELD